MAILAIGLANGGSEALADVVRDLHAGLACQDLDLADRVLGDAAAPAQQWDQPSRVGTLRAADVDREPHELARIVPSPNGGTTSVMSCIHVVMNEEWAHNRYANRDLDVLSKS